MTTINGTPQVNKPWNMGIGIKNSGKTFAKKVSIQCHMRPVAKNGEPNFDLDETPVMGTQSLALLPPNREFVSTSIGTENMNQAAVDQMKSGDAVVFVFGEIAYVDIFNCAHWTNFCSFFDPASGNYTVYKHHNDADENICP